MAYNTPVDASLSGSVKRCIVSQMHMHSNLLMLLLMLLLGLNYNCDCMINAVADLRRVVKRTCDGLTSVVADLGNIVGCDMIM